MRRYRILAAALTMMVAAQAGAREKTQFANGEPVQPDPGKALIAVREIISPDDYDVSIVLVRALDPETYRAVEASRRKDGSYRFAPDNVVYNRIDAPYASNGAERLFLFSVPPGDYAVAGIATVNKNSGPMRTCLCMGTVSFHAEAGRITDMGTFLAARDNLPTGIPELAPLVRGYDIHIQPTPYVAAIRIARDSSALPAALALLNPLPAEYRAVDKFPNSLGGSVERLAPLAGVLGYQDDKVLDLKAMP